MPGELPAFGRLFISNVSWCTFSWRLHLLTATDWYQPDLPLRLRKNLPLTPWNRAVYYTPEDPHGYTDYPFAEENREELGVQKLANSKLSWDGSD